MQIPEADGDPDGKPVARADATERRRRRLVDHRAPQARGHQRRLRRRLANEVGQRAEQVGPGLAPRQPAGQRGRDPARARRTSSTARRPIATPSCTASTSIKPELAAVLNALFDVNAPETDRTDIVQAVLQGIPGLNQHSGKFAGTPVDTLKLNLGVPRRRDPSRFGVIGGDNAGYPNGRRLDRRRGRHRPPGRRRDPERQPGAARRRRGPERQGVPVPVPVPRRTRSRDSTRTPASTSSRPTRPVPAGG